MNNMFFGKIMEDVRKHRDIKLAITEARMTYLVPRPNYHEKIFFSKDLLAIEMKKNTNA